MTEALNKEIVGLKAQVKEQTEALKALQQRNKEEEKRLVGQRKELATAKMDWEKFQESEKESRDKKLMELDCIAETLRAREITVSKMELRTKEEYDKIDNAHGALLTREEDLKANAKTIALEAEDSKARTVFVGQKFLALIAEQEAIGKLKDELCVARTAIADAEKANNVVLAKIQEAIVEQGKVIDEAEKAQSVILRASEEQEKAKQQKAELKSTVASIKSSKDELVEKKDELDTKERALRIKENELSKREKIIKELEKGGKK